jgi:hypothetical protein
MKFGPEDTEKKMLKIMWKQFQLEQQLHSKKERAKSLKDKSIQQAKNIFPIKRRAKGANPLSCRKRRKTND